MDVSTTTNYTATTASEMLCDNNNVDSSNGNNNNNNNNMEIDDNNAEVDVESPQMLSNAIQQVRDAVESSVPESLSIIYKTALEKCPHYVMTKEANPIYFLRRTSYNCWDAARLMCEYWNLRIEVFGHDRCYKSVLDLNGDNGALSESAIKLLETVTNIIIPYDIHGRPIFYKERINFTPKIQQQLGINAQAKIEGVFYMLQLLVDIPGIGTEGFSFINVFNEIKPNISPQVQQFFSRACNDYFPIKLNAVHIIHAPRLKVDNRSLAKETFVKEFIPFIWQYMENIFKTNIRRTANLVVLDKDYGPYSFLPSCEEQLASCLCDNNNKIGINNKIFLPPSAGGSWTLKEFIKWKKHMLYNHKQQQNNNNNNNNSCHNNNNSCHNKDEKVVVVVEKIHHNNHNNILSSSSSSSQNNNNNNNCSLLLTPLEILAVAAAGIEPLALEK